MMNIEHRTVFPTYSTIVKWLSTFCANAIASIHRHHLSSIIHSSSVNSSDCRSLYWTCCQTSVRTTKSYAPWHRRERSLTCLSRINTSNVKLTTNNALNSQKYSTSTHIHRIYNHPMSSNSSTHICRSMGGIYQGLRPHVGLCCSGMFDLLSCAFQLWLFFGSDMQPTVRSIGMLVNMRDGCVRTLSDLLGVSSSCALEADWKKKT